MANISPWQVPLARWRSIGVFPNSNDALNLGFIDPMLRRRLSPLARATLHLANDCAGDLPSIQMVYASRHGELTRTIELLKNLANGEELSPTTFGLSVLNSVPGIFSIARHDTASATALSAAEETFGFGLVDATARALASRQPVLYIHADTPPPPPLPHQAGDPADFLVTGMLIDPAASSWLSVSMQTSAAETASAPQAVSCMQALGNGKTTSWSSGKRRWTWTPEGSA